MDNAEKLESALEVLGKVEDAWSAAKFVQNESEYLYRMKKAVEYLGAEGTIKEREMLADVNAENEMKARFKADAEAETLFQKLLDARATVSARQSILNSDTKRPF